MTLTCVKDIKLERTRNKTVTTFLMYLLIIAMLASLIWGGNYGTYISWQPLFLTVTWLYPSIPVYTNDSLHFIGPVSNQWKFPWVLFNNLEWATALPTCLFLFIPLVFSCWVT